MKLLIDIGNTRSKWALCKAQGDIVARGFLGDGASFAHEVQIVDLKHRVKQVLVSCVGKVDSLRVITKMIETEFALTPSIVEVEPEFEGLTNAYNDLQRLGVDRWVAAIGARSLIPDGVLIVIDAGTAVTIDAVSDSDVFEGGVIMPGVEMMHDSLVGKTAGIKSKLSKVGSVIGKTTQECVNSGAQYGLVGAIERVVSEMLHVLEKSVIATQSSCGGASATTIVICGGDADRIQALTKLPMQKMPDLIFHGLHLISNKKNIQ